MMSTQSQKSKSDRLAELPPLLVFHKLLGHLTYGSTNYSPTRFERLIIQLERSDWPSIDIGNAIADQGRGVVVSFDDGYLHLADLLPEFIERLGLRPLIYMPSDLIGFSNDWDYSHRLCPTPHLDETGLRRLAEAGVTIGSHGQTHRDLTLCSPSQLKCELEDSRSRLQDITGQSIDTISYPFGRCNARMIEAAGQAGYARGFTMNFPQAGDDPLACGRYPVYGFDTLWSIRQKLEHGPAYHIERLKTAAIGRLAGGTVLLNRLRRV